LGRREHLRHHEFPQGNPTLAPTLVGEVDHAAGKFAQKTVPYFSSKEEFVGMAIKQETQTRIEPRAAEQFEIVECRVEIERGKHGKRFVEFFESSTVVEVEQAVDEGSFTSGNQDIVSATFRLKKAMSWEQQWTGGNSTVVGDTIEDDILAEASGKIIDGLEGLIGEPVEFERRVEGDDGVISERAGDTIPIQGNCGEGAGIDSVGYLSYTALFFETLEEVQKGAVAVILVIALTCLFESKEGRGLGELGERQTHSLHSYTRQI
jgi:hypothetical protein